MTLVLGACSHGDATSAVRPAANLTFPAGSRWGVSLSAEESEGGNTQNDWHVFEQMGNVPPAGMARTSTTSTTPTSPTANRST